MLTYVSVHRKETARKIKPSATQAKRKDKNEAHGVTDKTAVCYEQQDFTVNCNDGYASRPSKVLGDITNTGTRATGEKAKRRSKLAVATNSRNK